MPSRALLSGDSPSACRATLTQSINSNSLCRSTKINSFRVCKSKSFSLAKILTNRRIVSNVTKALTCVATQVPTQKQLPSIFVKTGCIALVGGLLRSGHGKFVGSHLLPMVYEVCNAAVTIEKIPRKKFLKFSVWSCVGDLFRDRKSVV